MDSQRGLSLRFPRFLRVREDKGIEDATPADTIADLFRMQVRGGEGKGGSRHGLTQRQGPVVSEWNPIRVAFHIASL